VLINEDRNVRFIDLFAGMGGFRIGFENACVNAGLKPECVFSSEIKPHATKIYRQNFPNEVIDGDITKIPAENIADFDVLLAGFPCQAFSQAGKKRGFDDIRGTLFFDIVRILKEKRPGGFILENVENLERHDGGNTLIVMLSILEKLNYNVNYKVLNSKEFGLAQSRERIYIVGALNTQINLDNHNVIHQNFSEIMQTGLPTYDSNFTKKVLSLYSPEELFGKKFKDKRGGEDNIHSWDLELRGSCNQDQKEILSRLLRYRRQKHWAKEIGIEWMDGMPLTAKQIHTFCPEYRIQKLTMLLDNLVDKTYLSFEHPKQKVENERIKDKSLPKGYNLITGKLSFELNIIMDPEGIAPTIVATEGDKYGVIDEKKLRRLSSRECLRLFGFPDSYVSNISIKELYDLIGNTVPINVVNFVTDRLLSQIYSQGAMDMMEYLRIRKENMLKLTEYLNQKIQQNPSVQWHYKEFGKQVEPYVISFLLGRGLLIDGKYIDQSDNKNEIPDIIDQQFESDIFIDIKAGNVVAFATGKKITNPNQDLSTTYRWRDHIFERFDPEHCFFLEVKYHHLKGNDLRVCECSIDHFYKYVGKTTEGLIAHRRRNVRTKSWDTEPQFQSADEFKELLAETISLSIKNQILKNIGDLTKSDFEEVEVDFGRKANDD